MSVDFKQIIIELRSLVINLEERCAKAEVKLAQCEESLKLKQQQIVQLEAECQAISSKYQSLQSGMTQCGTTEEVTLLKERYLAMVREIDDCIAKLETGN